MRKSVKSFLIALVLTGLGGCTRYGGVAAVGTDRVVIVRSGAFSHRVFVCRVADSGVSDCRENETP